jgi:hypothetical protein
MQSDQRFCKLKFSGAVQLENIEHQPLRTTVLETMGRPSSPDSRASFHVGSDQVLWTLDARK